MSRYSGSSAYNQSVYRIYEDCYRISWTVDFYYRTSRLRHPRRFSRDTDEAGAKRFAKKHGLHFPAVAQK